MHGNDIDMQAGRACLTEYLHDMRCFQEAHTRRQMVLDETNQSNKVPEGSDPLTPIVASQIVRNGGWTVALICPVAATILFIALRTAGCAVRDSALDLGSHGLSNEGKSSNGTEYRSALERRWPDMVGKRPVKTEGDGGGDA